MVPLHDLGQDEYVVATVRKVLGIKVPSRFSERFSREPFGKTVPQEARRSVAFAQTLRTPLVGNALDFAETLVETLPRLRRGSACILITPSLDRAWVRPASTLREAAIATQAVIVAAPTQTDERDHARRNQLFGELAIAGVTATYLGAGASISDLFRDAAGAVA